MIGVVEHMASKMSEAERLNTAVDMAVAILEQIAYGMEDTGDDSPSPMSNIQMATMARAALATMGGYLAAGKPADDLREPDPLRELVQCEKTWSASEIGPIRQCNAVAADGFAYCELHKCQGNGCPEEAFAGEDHCTRHLTGG